MCSSDLMIYRITVDNGRFPLTCDCTTAHEALGCIEALTTGLLSNAPIDWNMDAIMNNLIEMKKGNMLRESNAWWAIERIEDD